MNEYSTEENKMYNYTPNLSLHYLIKLKPHKIAILKSIVTVVYNSTVTLE